MVTKAISARAYFGDRKPTTLMHKEDILTFASKKRP